MMSDQRIADPDNAQVAAWLRQAAELLQAQGANPFRVGAYRRAADTVEQYGGSLRTLFAAEGRDGLDALPGIGAGIAAAIAEMLDTGRWAQLQRLRGSLDPAALFQTVPGMGPGFAQRYTTRLASKPSKRSRWLATRDGSRKSRGSGARRAAAIRAAVAEILNRSRLRRHVALSAAAEPAAAAEPSVAMLLDVDREYLDKARAGALPTIAPRRFNPGQKAWLPVLHTGRDDWHFTALFSNTANAHELGRTHDWVVLYFHDDGHAGTAAHGSDRTARHARRPPRRARPRARSAEPITSSSRPR